MQGLQLVHGPVVKERLEHVDGGIGRKDVKPKETYTVRIVGQKLPESGAHAVHFEMDGKSVVSGVGGP
jgi:hypothetical protein